MRPWHSRALLCLIAFVVTSAKRVQGTVTLAERQARVVTKFCFDFNAKCPLEGNCPVEQHPGIMEFNIFSGKRSDGKAVVMPPMLPPGARTDLAEGGFVHMPDNPTLAGVRAPGGGAPEVYIALLDDEYFSFPEVSQVWGEANCTDLLHAAKKNFQLNWDLVSTWQGESIMTPLAERVRPRWWYIAFVSCSPYKVDLSYRMHFTNQLIGWEREFSMDTAGLIEVTLFICILLGALLLMQIGSLNDWVMRSHMQRWDRLHPALLLVTAALVLAMLGEMAWFAYFLHFQSNGEGLVQYDVAARGLIMAAKTVMQILFMLQAQGQSISSPEISWVEHRELVVGQCVFGCLSFLLEVWSDSEFWTTSTEYVYDTRPGIALVAFDCLWLWMYASRSLRTFQQETRLKARTFYRIYSPIFGVWFASLPLIAAVARVLAPWVRHRIIFIVSGCVHTCTLAVLVHSFRPSVAVHLYDLTMSEYEPVVNHEELNSMLGFKGDDDIL